MAPPPRFLPVLPAPVAAAQMHVPAPVPGPASAAAPVSPSVSSVGAASSVLPAAPKAVREANPHAPVPTVPAQEAPLPLPLKSLVAQTQFMNANHPYFKRCTAFRDDVSAAIAALREAVKAGTPTSERKKLLKSAEDLLNRVMNERSRSVSVNEDDLYTTAPRALNEPAALRSDPTRHAYKSTLTQEARNAHEAMLRLQEKWQKLKSDPQLYQAHGALIDQKLAECEKNVALTEVEAAFSASDEEGLYAAVQSVHFLLQALIHPEEYSNQVLLSGMSSRLDLARQLRVVSENISHQIDSEMPRRSPAFKAVIEAVGPGAQGQVVAMQNSVGLLGLSLMLVEYSRSLMAQADFISIAFEQVALLEGVEKLPCQQALNQYGKWLVQMERDHALHTIVTQQPALMKSLDKALSEMLSHAASLMPQASHPNAEKCLKNVNDEIAKLAAASAPDSKRLLELKIFRLGLSQLILAKADAQGVMDLYEQRYALLSNEVNQIAAILYGQSASAPLIQPQDANETVVIKSLQKLAEVLDQPLPKNLTKPPFDYEALRAFIVQLKNSAFSARAALVPLLDGLMTQWGLQPEPLPERFQALLKNPNGASQKPKEAAKYQALMRDYEQWISTHYRQGIDALKRVLGVEALPVDPAHEMHELLRFLRAAQSNTASEIFSEKQTSPLLRTLTRTLEERMWLKQSDVQLLIAHLNDKKLSEFSQESLTALSRNLKAPLPLREAARKLLNPQVWTAFVNAVKEGKPTLSLVDLAHWECQLARYSAGVKDERGFDLPPRSIPLAWVSEGITEHVQALLSEESDRAWSHILSPVRQKFVTHYMALNAEEKRHVAALYNLRMGNDQTAFLRMLSDFPGMFRGSLLHHYFRAQGHVDSHSFAEALMQGENPVNAHLGRDAQGELLFSAEEPFWRPEDADVRRERGKNLKYYQRLAQRLSDKIAEAEQTLEQAPLAFTRGVKSEDDQWLHQIADHVSPRLGAMARRGSQAIERHLNDPIVLRLREEIAQARAALLLLDGAIQAQSKSPNLKGVDEAAQGAAQAVGQMVTSSLGEYSFKRNEYQVSYNRLMQHPAAKVFIALSTLMALPAELPAAGIAARTIGLRETLVLMGIGMGRGIAIGAAVSALTTAPALLDGNLKGAVNVTAQNISLGGSLGAAMGSFHSVMAASLAASNDAFMAAYQANALRAGFLSDLPASTLLGLGFRERALMFAALVGLMEAPVALQQMYQQWLEQKFPQASRKALLDTAFEDDAARQASRAHEDEMAQAMAHQAHSVKEYAAMAVIDDLLGGLFAGFAGRIPGFGRLVRLYAKQTHLLGFLGATMMRHLLDFKRDDFPKPLPPPRPRMLTPAHKR